jgi:hypothetical protein
MRLLMSMPPITSHHFSPSFDRTHAKLFCSEKTPPVSQSLLGWFSNFRHTNDEYILTHQSLDGYLYIRFLKMMIFMSLIGCCITWPILFPVNATGGGGESGLDILSFSNVQNPTRYFAHALTAWAFFSESNPIVEGGMRLLTDAAGSLCHVPHRKRNNIPGQD